MELRHLRYFIAIAEERSISRAAEQLWIAQPGLSTQLRRLEAELGIKLFDGNTRGVELTPAGEVFLEHARAVISAAEEARATGANLVSGLAGTIRLGLASETSTRISPSLLDGFWREHPDVTVTVVESYAGTVMRDLRHGRLDAVIAPAACGSADLRSLPLATEPWAVLVGRGHRLAVPGAIGPDELHDQPIVMTGHRDGAAHDRAVADLLRSFGVTPVRHRGGPGPALYAAVVTGDAVALTTLPAATSSELIARPLEPGRSVPFSLAVARRNTLAGAPRAHPRRSGPCRGATARDPAGSRSGGVREAS
jgi:LysR family transcriptional regulator, cyn operon transcriptional activator